MHATEVTWQETLVSIYYFEMVLDHLVMANINLVI